MPALIAAVSLYGLVANPAHVTRQVQDLTTGLPTEARTLMIYQVHQFAQQPPSTLGVSAALGIIVALWSASSGVRWMLFALSLTSDESEGRSFMRLRGTAPVLTVAGALALEANLTLVTASQELAGSAVATIVAIVAIVASVGRELYSSLTNRLDKTYGSLVGFIVLMLWLMAMAFAVLLGAEVNA